MQQKLLKHSTTVKQSDRPRPAPTRTDRGQIAVVSPLSLRCGIAEYSRQLANAFRLLGLPCILADSGIPQKAHGIDTGRRLTASIQYHPDFYGPSELVAMARQWAAPNASISVTFHHTKLPSLKYLRQLDKLGSSFVVHTEQSLAILKESGFDRSFRLSMGVPLVDDEPPETARDRLGLTTGPVIGTCGFLRPHKGLAELIRAMPLLGKKHPGIVLIAMQPLHPLDESAAYLLRCIRSINGLHLETKVKIYVDFLDSTELIQRLHACDVIVLPDAHSTEGASASARTAIAARRPVVTSPSRIFDDVADVVLRARGTTPFVLARAVEEVLSSPELSRSLAEAASRYADDHPWEASAYRMLEIFQYTPESRSESEWHR